MAAPAPPVILPAITKQTGVVIFLHHSGANGLSWAKRFESMRLPHIKYVFPNASVRALTLYDGVQQTAWFDVCGFSTNAPVDEKGLAEATAMVRKLVAIEIADGTPSERILIAGHSQGGGLALYATITYDKTLAGSVAMNCWLADYRPTVTKKFTEANRLVPYFQLHGDKDPFIALKYAELSKNIAKGANVTNYVMKIYKNSAHWPTPEMFDDMQKFIADHLPNIEEAQPANGDSEK